MKKYYVVIQRSNYSTTIVTTKTQVKDIINVSIDTIDRHLAKKEYYINDGFTVTIGYGITKNPKIVKRCKRNFKIK